jgi:hypothetical protein
MVTCLGLESAKVVLQENTSLATLVELFYAMIVQLGNTAANPQPNYARIVKLGGFLQAMVGHFVISVPVGRAPTVGLPNEIAAVAPVVNILKTDLRLAFDVIQAKCTSVEQCLQIHPRHAWIVRLGSIEKMKRSMHWCVNCAAEASSPSTLGHSSA